MNHSEDKVLAASAVEMAPRRGGSWVWQAGLLAVALGVLYHDVLARLFNQWVNDDNYSHGFFVPLFALYVAWQRREQLRALPLAPSWMGLPVIVGSLLMLSVGVLGAELFLSRSSLIFLLGGILLYQFGWGHFRALFFPWACLFLAVPIPKIVFNQIAFPLQLLASQLASNMLELLAVPSLREGNVIHLPAMTLEVVDACSGIRSLVSLGTLAIIYGYFLEPRVWRRVILAVAAIPIAVAANALRVMGTGLLGHYWDPDKAEGFFHTFSGWVIFVLSVVLLFSVHGLMNLWDRWRGRRRAAAAGAGGGGGKQ